DRPNAAEGCSDRAVRGDLAQLQADGLPVAEAADPGGRTVAPSKRCRLHRTRIGIDPVPMNTRRPREYTSAEAADPVPGPSHYGVIWPPPVEALLEVRDEDTALDERRRGVPAAGVRSREGQPCSEQAREPGEGSQAAGVRPHLSRFRSAMPPSRSLE